MPSSEPHCDETSSPIDIESLRDPSELPHHWQLRKSFLLAHKGKYSNDRLVCLSHVFVNVECMGTKYPEEVMETVKELSSDIDKSIIQNTSEQEKQQEQPRHEQHPQHHHHYQQMNNQRNMPRYHERPYQDRQSSAPWRGHHGQPQQRYSAPSFPRQYQAPQQRHFVPPQMRAPHSDAPQNRHGGPYQPRPRGRPFTHQDQRFRRERY